MSHCRRYQELIEALLAGMSTTEERQDLEEHCAGCPECAELLTLHESLVEAGDEVPTPERSALRDMREGVLAAVAPLQPADSRRPREAPRAGFFADVGRLWRAHPVPALLATAAVLVCAVLVGRWQQAPVPPLEDQWLQQAVSAPTAQAAGLDSYWDTPYTFANVSVRPRDTGQLALSFDVCRHVDVEVARTSPLAREVLLHAILEPSSMGSRLRAMDLTTGTGDRRLKDALILTMHNDPDATVRLNALAVLDRYPYDTLVQDALLEVLRQDRDVQMRLTAIETLARRKVGLETIRDAVGETDAGGTLDLLRQASLEF